MLLSVFNFQNILVLLTKVDVDLAILGLRYFHVQRPPTLNSIVAGECHKDNGRVCKNFYEMPKIKQVWIFKKNSAF